MEIPRIAIPTSLGHLAEDARAYRSLHLSSVLQVLTHSQPDDGSHRPVVVVCDPPQPLSIIVGEPHRGNNIVRLFVCHRHPPIP